MGTRVILNRSKDKKKNKNKNKLAMLNFYVDYRSDSKGGKHKINKKIKKAETIIQMTKCKTHAKLCHLL